jgi:hypothetical protein
MTYTLTSGTAVIRDVDGALIPDDPMNADWQVYQAWISSGNTATAYTPPSPAAPTYNFLQFMALFTQAEQLSIISSTDPQTKVFVYMAAGEASVFDSVGSPLTNPLIVEGINYLVTGPGLLTSDRAAQILAGTPAPTA